MSTITMFVTLTKICCPGCGGVYAIAEDYRAEAERLGEFKKCWACPYCKVERGYGTGEIQRLRSQLEREQGRTATQMRRAERAEGEAEHFRKSRDGVRGALARTKNRIAAGVCPCCTRTFQNLARHVATKHPDYTKEA